MRYWLIFPIHGIMTVSDSRQTYPRSILLRLSSIVDPVLKKTFAQTFYMMWNGIEQGQADTSFVYVTMDEKVRIRDSIDVIFRDFE